jgi:hypothetical protein
VLPQHQRLHVGRAQRAQRQRRGSLEAPLLLGVAPARLLLLLLLLLQLRAATLRLGLPPALLLLPLQLL